MISKAMIYVLSGSGKPMMPTIRAGHIRRLLNKGKARIVSHVPYTVQLKYETEEKVQPVYGGTDPGRTNIGGAAVSDKGIVLYRGHVETRNREVSRFMAERKRHRQASRRGERLARKRLAKKHGTLMESGSVERKLPGYEDGTVTVKGIINTEAKFNNRVRPEGWITPSVRQLVQTHISAVRKVTEILPVTDWSMEVNRFAFMRMEDGTCRGNDFKSGRMRGYASVDKYVYARQDGKCACCGKPIEEYHHVVPRHEYGSDRPENIAGLCKGCHRKIHTGQLKLDLEGFHKKYGALSVLNTAIPFLYKGLCKMFGEEHVHVVTGWETQRFRDRNGLSKDHDIDAVAVACTAAVVVPNIGNMPECFELRQFRRHDRQIVMKQSERAYFLPEDPKKAVCRNRHKRYGQKCDSLEEFRKARPKDIGGLIVRKSTRSYNNPDRLMPGALYLHNGEVHVLTGTKDKGTRFMYEEGPKSGVSARRCVVLRRNTGLVYRA